MKELCSSRRAVRVIGIGDDGCRGLNSRAIGAISEAQVLVGGARQLAFFPEFAGERIVLEGGLLNALDRVVSLAEDNCVAVLASGDPLFFGVGALVARKVGAEDVEILPQPSSMQLAFARVGLKWDDAQFFSVHGRPLAGLANRLRDCEKAAVLTDQTNHPTAIAQHLLKYGRTEFLAWVCENLGGPGERVRSYTLPQLAQETEIGDLNVLLLSRKPSASLLAAKGEERESVIPFLPEEAFAKRMPKKGLITKQEVRLLSLARLGLKRNSVVWDIGAGSGSVAIEAARLAPEGRVIAIETDPEGVAICRDNALAHGTDNVAVVEGRAPEALDDLEAPDAVFVGGSKGSLATIVEVCLRRLRPGGSIVVNAITLENVAEAHAAFKAAKKTHGVTVEATLLQVSRAVPLAHYLRFEALNPIHVFSAKKPREQVA